MMDPFLLKLTQFEKTGSIRKNFISLGNLTFTLLLFDSRICLPFNKENALNLKKSQVKPRKIKIEREKILKPEKKISKTFIRVFTTFITINQPTTVEALT